MCGAQSNKLSSFSFGAASLASQDPCTLAPVKLTLRVRRDIYQPQTCDETLKESNLQTFTKFQYELYNFQFCYSATVQALPADYCTRTKCLSVAASRVRIAETRKWNPFGIGGNYLILHSACVPKTPCRWTYVMLSYVPCDSLGTSHDRLVK